MGKPSPHATHSVTDCGRGRASQIPSKPACQMGRFSRCSSGSPPLLENPYITCKCCLTLVWFHNHWYIFSAMPLFWTKFEIFFGCCQFFDTWILCVASLSWPWLFALCPPAKVLPEKKIDRSRSERNIDKDSNLWLPTRSLIAMALDRITELTSIQEVTHFTHAFWT